MAVDVLISKGVPEDRIFFLNVMASPEGVSRFAQKFPKARVVTAFVDQGLDENKSVRHNPYNLTFLMSAIRFIVPGLGDFGDRFYTL